jgi:hypothetical protein
VIFIDREDGWIGRGNPYGGFRSSSSEFTVAALLIGYRSRADQLDVSIHQGQYRDGRGAGYAYYRRVIRPPRHARQEGRVHRS